MDLWTIDFETYWGDDYTLSKLTTEAYVRDPRFEEIICSFKKNDEATYWVDGPDIHRHVRRLDLENCAVLCQHSHFDGLILSHHHGIHPKRWFDTLSMARALHGAKGGLKLGELAKKYNLQDKGDEVNRTRNMHRVDFTPAALEQYAEYCCTDTDITYQLFHKMLPRFPASELKLIDRKIRMFTEPMFRANVSLLKEYITLIKARKNELLLQAGVLKDEVMSNERFAQLLRDHGIDPPMKISKTSGKYDKRFGSVDKKGNLRIDKRTGKPFTEFHPKTWTYAFAKTDPAMQDLEEHADETIQVLIAARLKNKSTIEETRAKRIVEMASRGNICIYIKHYGADQTGRDSGGDKMNWQNLTRKGILRRSLLAPKGHLCAVRDSSNIEAREGDWLARQMDMVEVYKKADAKLGPDVYCVMAGKIYGYRVTKEDNPDERQMGKIAKLGLGFGMGDAKFPFAVRAQAKDPKTGRPLIISPAFSAHVVKVYRDSHFKVVEMWDRAREALWMIIKGKYNAPVDPRGIILTAKDGLWLPNGMKIRYSGLKYGENPFGDGKAFTYWNGRSVETIYGAKVVENIVQALARIIVMEQCLLVKGWPWKMPTHDEGVWIIRDDPVEIQEWTQASEEAFATPLDWCRSLPLHSEGGIHRSYGKAKQ